MAYRISRTSDGLWHTHNDGRALTAAGQALMPTADWDTAVQMLSRAWAEAGAPIGDPAETVVLRPFTLPVAWVEGEATGDGRKIAVDAVKPRNLPLPFLMLDHTDLGGHIGAIVCGRVDTLTTIDDPEVAGQKIGTGTGVYAADPFGDRAYAAALSATARGVSIDMTACEVEYVYPTPPADLELDEDDLWLWEMMQWPEQVFTYAEIGAVTQCPIPAFARAYVQVNGADFAEPGRPAGAPEDTDGGGPLTASARRSSVESFGQTREMGVWWHMSKIPARLRPVTASGSASDLFPTPLRPKSSWFTDPKMEVATVTVITDEGQVWGYACTWDVEHIGLPGKHRTAPRSKTNYSHFRRGNVLTAEGTLIPTGCLTINGCEAHSDLRIGLTEAARLYDDTSTAWADVVVGEDDIGVWFAGYVRPGTTQATISAARASNLSGDWRPADTDGDGVEDWVEAVAFMCVPVPGFPIPRVLAAGGRLVAMVAAGSATLARLHAEGSDEARLQGMVASAVAPLRRELDDLQRPGRIAAARAQLARR